MNINSKVFAGGILGGLVAFVWKIVSWTILPWHKMLIQSFQNPDAVEKVIRANALENGIYFSEQGPLIFAMIDLHSSSLDLFAFIVSLALQIGGGCLIAWLVLQSNKTKYWQRVSFVTTIAIVIALLAYLPEWNWIRFTGAYTFVRILDTLVAWFLAGLVIAKVVGSKTLADRRKTR